jgi:hypothetical protein
MSNNNQSSEQIMNDIQSLQKMEQEMFSSLDSNPNLSISQKKELTDKIKKISNMRQGLYGTIGGMNSVFAKTYTATSGALNQQLNAVGIIENQLKESRKKMEIMEIEKINKVRLVEINDYFGEKYAEHALFMQIIIFTLIPIIILILLFNKEIISDKVFYALITIVACIGALFGWPRLFSIMNRDNMNYKEYDWYFDASAAPLPGTDASNNDPWLAPLSTLGTCIGDACCTGNNMTYDTSSNTCVLGDGSGNNTSKNSGKESFITEGMIESMISSSTNQNKYKQMNNSNFMPSTSESFINFKF